MHSGDAAANHAWEQFSKADNMTDKMGALSALNHVDSSYRQNSLDAFYQEFKQEPLVVNKWLTLQATSSLPGTLERIKALLDHEAYDATNPNNVYALICALVQIWLSCMEVQVMGMSLLRIR